MRPLVDIRQFREDADKFLRELGARDRIPRVLTWLLRLATGLSLTSVLTAVVAVPFTVVFLTATQGRLRISIFAATAAVLVALSCCGILLMLLQSRLAALVGRTSA